MGLARTEFIVTNHIGVHPMALARFPQLKDQAAASADRERIGNEDAREFFVSRFSEGVARIAAAFYPKPVIVRTSDFKTNEYARLLGGKEFEPEEENPMLGYPRGLPLLPSRIRGRLCPGVRCSGACTQRYGADQLKVMIPFCRTVDEGKKVSSHASPRLGTRPGWP